MRQFDVLTIRPDVLMTGQTSAMMAIRDPDIRLMLRVRDQNDSAAFAYLVERYQHRLVGILHHIVGTAEEAEDLAQEVFLRVYRTRANYTPKAKFSTWLFTIANNLALNAIRDRQRRNNVPLELNESGPQAAQHPPAHRDPAPGDQLQQQELAAVIRRALEELNERQRVAIVLNKFEDMDYAEIAQVMGLSTKAVKSLLCRARVKLRDALQPYIDMENSDMNRPPPPTPSDRAVPDADVDAD